MSVPNKEKKCHNIETHQLTDSDRSKSLKSCEKVLKNSNISGRTVQYSTVQYSTVRKSTVQYSRIVQICTIQRYSVLSRGGLIWDESIGLSYLVQRRINMGQINMGLSDLVQRRIKLRQINWDEIGLSESGNYSKRLLDARNYHKELTVHPSPFRKGIKKGSNQDESLKVWNGMICPGLVVKVDVRKVMNTNLEPAGKVLKVEIWFTNLHSQRIKSVLAVFIVVWSSSVKIRNKIQKMVNGNGGKGNNLLKVISWNLGSRKWCNKTDEINHLVLEHNPDIVAISEANLHSSSGCHETNIKGYNLITTLDYKDTGISRLVVLAKLDLNYKILTDKMEPGIATIWLEFPRQGKKPFLFGALYREHKLLYQTDPDTTGDPANQKIRWRKIIDKWAALRDGVETLVVGDFNVDHMRWSDQDYHNKDMIELIKDKI